MQKYGWGLPIDVSADGWQIDQIIWIFHVMMVVIFVGWLIFFVWTLFRFRQRPGHKADYHTPHFKLPTYLEIAVALAEAALLVAFSFPIWANHKVNKPSGDDVLNVRVVAQQFAWNIHYPGADKAFGRTDPKLMSSTNPVGLDRQDPAAADDVVAINQFHVPVGSPVVAQLSSKDVIHSFNIPVLRVKQDATPGHVSPVWFTAKQEGQFEIACAQLCGLGHYRMRGFFISESPEKFAEWLSSQAPKKV